MSRRGDVRALGLLPAPAMLLVTSLIGFFQRGGVPEVDPGIALIQTTSSESADLSRLSRAAAKRGAQLAVWPELSGNGSTVGGNPSPLRKLAQEPGMPAFITTFTDDAKPMPHNACALFTAEGESQRYYKRKPFGGERKMHAAGASPVAVDWNRLRIGLAVCFDGCYPAVMRETARMDGVNLVVLPSMGPESPYGVIQALHAAFAPFRAAEMGMPVVTCDVSGYSMAVDGNGRIIAQAAPGQVEPLIVYVPALRHQTLYRQWGDWFLYVCGATAVFGMWRSYRARRRAGARPADGVAPV